MGRIGLRKRRYKFYRTGLSKSSFKRMVEVNQGYNRYIDGLYKRRSKMKIKAYELLMLCRLAKDLRWQVEKILKKLPQRERNVLKYRLFNDSLTLQTIGNMMGISRERVRLLEARALRKLAWQLEFGGFSLDVKFGTEIIKFKNVQKEITQVTIPKNLLEIPIWMIGHFGFTESWSIRTINCLNRAKIKTLGDLKKYNLDSGYHLNSLLNFRNFGKKSLAEVKNKLSEFVLSALFKSS